MLTEIMMQEHYREGERSGFTKGERSGFTKGERSGFTKGERSGMRKGYYVLLIEKCRKKYRKGKNADEIAGELEEERDLIGRIIREAFLYIIVDKRTYILYNECNRS